MKYIIKNYSQGISVCISLDGKILVFDTKDEANELINNSYLSIKKECLVIESTFIMTDDGYINYKDALKILKERGIYKDNKDIKLKEIHFFEYHALDRYVCLSWNETEAAIERGDDIINTLQMGRLSTDLVSLGYRIFVHETPDEFYEIVIGGVNTRTKKALRMEHNLFKMWRANAFRKNEVE